MVLTTACFVALGCTYHHHRVVISRWTPIDDALSTRRWSATYHAYRGQLCHFFRKRKQFRHRPERLTTKVLVEPSEDDANALARKIFCNLDNPGFEELHLIDANYFHLLLLDNPEHVRRRCHNS
jgi:hypothetical protein